MSDTFPRPPQDPGRLPELRGWDAIPPFEAPPPVASPGHAPVADAGNGLPAFEPHGLLSRLDQAPQRRRTWRERLRLGAFLAFLVSLFLHSFLLALFIGGTIPGLPEGQEGIPVDVITQEQYDILLGNGSSQGGKPPKVADSATGIEPSLQTPTPPSPQKSESVTEQRQAPIIVSAPDSSETVAKGTSDNTNDAGAAAPRKAETKDRGKGSLKDSAPSRRTDPKEKPDSPREDARTQAEPSPTKPGAEGGEMRRKASRGGVGEELGPLPPSMRQALMQLLQKQIELCYVPPGGIKDVAEMPLVMIRFHRDGSLDGMPKSLRFERTAAGKSMVKAALKAVRQCAPYRMPPRFAAYYDDWREIKAQFEFASR